MSGPKETPAARRQELPDLAALALFVAVVDTGSLGAGARSLGIHQPNASRTLSRLEARAGMTLLERSPRGTRPTAAGVLYAAHARELLEAADTFTRWLAHAAQDTPQELSVGASLTIAEHLLPAWLAALARRLPTVRLLPHLANSAEIITQVREGTLPLGFVETPHVPSGLNASTLTTDELVVVVSRRHPWAGRTNLTLAELARTPLVTREAGSGTREAFEQLVPGAAQTPPLQTLPSNAAVMVAVGAGSGPAVLSRLAVRTALAEHRLVEVPLVEGKLLRPLQAIWAGPRRVTGPAGELLAIASAQTSQIAGPGRPEETPRP